MDKDQEIQNETCRELERVTGKKSIPPTTSTKPCTWAEKHVAELQVITEESAKFNMVVDNCHEHPRKEH